MSGARLGQRARQLASFIRREADCYGVGVEIEMGGTHPRAVLSRDGQSRKLFFSGTPSDFRIKDNLIRDVRRIFREMGWEKTPVRMATIGKGSMFDAQRTTLGAASEVRHIKPESSTPSLASLGKIMLKGIALPDIPECARAEHASGAKRSAEYGEFLSRRTAFANATRAAGASWEDIADALTLAGHPIKAQSLQVHDLRPREEPALPPPPAIRNAPASPDLVGAIAAMVEGLVSERTASLQAEVKRLRDKADKWDALKGLVEQDG